MEERHISKAVVQRLPRYYRYLGNLLDQKTERISSNELSQLMKVTASQIRQDLNNFGGFGQQGYGYNVKSLHHEIGVILGLEKSYNMIVVGSGHLGQAIANYVKSEKKGFNVIGLFDKSPDLVGKSVRGDLVVRPMDELPSFLSENKVDIATLTLPAAGAENTLPVLLANGVTAFWNFAHTDLEVPEGVTVQNVHLSESLMQLTYRINH